MGKPPYCEVAFKSVTDGSTLPDLTVTISFDDFFSRSIDTFTIIRAAEKPFECQLHNLNNLIIIIVVAVEEHKVAIDDIDLGKYTIHVYFNVLYQLTLDSNTSEGVQILKPSSMSDETCQLHYTSAMYIFT